MDVRRYTVAEVRAQKAARLSAALGKSDEEAAARLADNNRDAETAACQDLRLALYKRALNACIPFIKARDKEVILAIVRLGIGDEVRLRARRPPHG